MKTRVNKTDIERLLCKSKSSGRNYNEVKKAIKKRENVEIDWNVIRMDIAIIPETIVSGKNPEYVAQFTTSGFDKYGFGEVIVIGKSNNENKITELINRFCVLLAEGDEFNPNNTHTIGDVEGKIDFTFNVFYGQEIYFYDNNLCVKHRENGSIWVQLIPDFENNL